MNIKIFGFALLCVVVPATVCDGWLISDLKENFLSGFDLLFETKPQRLATIVLKHVKKFESSDLFKGVDSIVNLIDHILNKLTEGQLDLSEDRLLSCWGCSVTTDMIISKYNWFGGEGKLLTGLLLAPYLRKAAKQDLLPSVGIELFLKDWPTINYVLRNTKNLTGKKVCSVLLQHKQCFSEVIDPWTVNIRPGVSVLRTLQTDNIISDATTEATNDTTTETTTGATTEATNATTTDATTEATTKATPNETPIKIAQLTDVNVDMGYTPNTDVTCEQPVCCRSTGRFSSTEARAGQWGTLSDCDMPTATVSKWMEHFKTEVAANVTHLYVTGNVLGHNVWERTQQETKTDLKWFYGELKKALSGTKVTVYPVLGNLDTSPGHLFAPTDVANRDPQLGNRWLYEFLAEEWSRFLPEDATATIRAGGFYTVKTASGIRIVALNSNVCNVKNLWLVHNPVDTYNQLQWLADTLAKAEQNQETVHILSHMPPGHPDCLKQWTHVFDDIVQRFAHTIAAQFNGHSHNGNVKMFVNSSQRGQIVNVAYTGGSFSTFKLMNPSYRVYDVSENTKQVVDFTEYIVDINEANRNRDHAPKWKKSYSFLDEFQLPNANLTTLAKFVTNMYKAPEKRMKFCTVNLRNSEALIAEKEWCDSNGTGDMLCDSLTTDLIDDQETICRGFSKSA